MGNVAPHDVEVWPEPPPWRRFECKGTERDRKGIPAEPLGDTFRARDEIVELVNAAIHLRRPLLVTGKPGTGKSSLAHAIAYELKLGKLLEWPITSRSTLQEGLYHYDAIGRLQDVSVVERARDKGGQMATPDIDKFISLRPLGTALLPASRPRVLLVDEIDKGDVDLPNDLLHVFEKGEFEIPELARDAKKKAIVRPADGDEGVEIERGKVQCREFPIVILTSNGEREFPAAFKRRCIRVTMPEPKDDIELKEIVKAHFGKTKEAQDAALAIATPLILAFLAKRTEGDLATDQLLNAIRLRMSGGDLDENSVLHNALLRPLSSTG